MDMGIGQAIPQPDRVAIWLGKSNTRDWVGEPSYAPTHQVASWPDLFQTVPHKKAFLKLAKLVEDVRLDAEALKYYWFHKISLRLFMSLRLCWLQKKSVWMQTPWKSLGHHFSTFWRSAEASFGLCSISWNFALEKYISSFSKSYHLRRRHLMTFA